MVEVKACSFASWDRVLPISCKEHRSCLQGRPVSFWISLLFSLSVLLSFSLCWLLPFQNICISTISILCGLSQQLDQEESSQCTAPGQAGRSKPERNNVPDYNLSCCVHSIPGFYKLTSIFLIVLKWERIATLLNILGGFRKPRPPFAKQLASLSSCAALERAPLQLSLALRLLMSWDSTPSHSVPLFWGTKCPLSLSLTF